MTLPAILAIYAFGIAMILLFRQYTRRFLARYPAIRDQADLDAFKALARRNMQAALPFGLVLIVGVALSLDYVQDTGGGGFLLSLILNGLLFGAAMLLRADEKKVRDLPCADPQLAEEYHRISRAWLSDFWPDF